MSDNFSNLDKRVKKFLGNPYQAEEQCHIYTNEIHLFMHCHMKAYDQTGEGKNRCFDYTDKYGVPINVEDHQTEGHRAMDKSLAENMFKVTKVDELDFGIRFPPVAGYAGTAHLYKKIEGHDNEPWNWTGWIPRWRREMIWDPDNHKNICISNRTFMALRANEIQNDFWDLHPFANADADAEELCRDFIGNHSAYGGGYFHEGKTWGRYLHVNAIKSIELEPRDEHHRYVCLFTKSSSKTKFSF